MDHIQVDRLADRAVAQLFRREERVSLELHRDVAHHLVDEPESVLARVPGNIEKHRPHARGPLAHGWLDTWSELSVPERLDELIVTMLDAGNVTLRQVAPFGGVLTQDERLAAIARAAVRSPASGR